MATFKLIKSTTVATLKELFNTEFGAKLRIYSGRSQADDSATLGELGLTNEGNFECRASLTVGSFIERMQSEQGLKVKVYTCDDWVAVLNGLTLESAGKVKKNAVKADMESMIAYQRTDNAVETAVVDIKKSATYGDYTINIASNNSVTVLKGGVACDNAKGALREVAALVGFEVDAAWTTQQFGSKLVDFLNANPTQASASKSEPNKSQKQHVRVDVEITEHEYMAFDSDDEMVGSSSFAFNGDDSPGFICITVDGKEIEFDEEALLDRSEYSDYEPFDMEEKWNSEDIVKFGYYDNLAGKTWEFDVENFDINKLSFYYECFDAIFGPANHNWEEHRITLRYDGKEVEEDLEAYGCSDGDFEQIWDMYDDED